MYNNAEIGSKVKILIDDESPYNRFKKGDVGKILKHDVDEHSEYEHYVEIAKTSKYKNTITVKIYFRKCEVEFIN